jgi:hypothetical protein
MMVVGECERHNCNEYADGFRSENERDSAIFYRFVVSEPLSVESRADGRFDQPCARPQSAVSRKRQFGQGTRKTLK